MEKPCAHCGLPMQQRVRERAIFCSLACKDKARNIRRQAHIVAVRGPRHCEHCGEAIDSSRHGQSRFCSRECWTKRYNKEKAARLKADRLALVGPCRVCGGTIPAERTARAIYCSAGCLRTAQAQQKQESAPGYMRQYLYGITPEEYAALLESQDGRCAICGTDAAGGKGSWHVDHCHNTGAIRGLLCHHCNVMLGNADDDPARLRSAALYLEQHP